MSTFIRFSSTIILLLTARSIANVSSVENERELAFRGFYNWEWDDEGSNLTTARHSNSSTRTKRDGGITVAMLTGIIGMTSRAVSELITYRPVPSNGGCKWFGNSPFCREHCPPEYDLIRMDNGRCNNFWLSAFCPPDDSFGEPCSTLLGGYFKKRFCCKSDPNECTWSGRWMGAMDSHNLYCRYDNSVGRCGELSCAVNHFKRKLNARSPIGGERCDQLEMFNLTGHATCGYIAWRDCEGKMANSWYKTGG